MNSSTLYPLIRVSAAIAIMQIPCHAITVMDYMIIANGDPDDIDKALALSDSELGAIGVNNSTSLPSGNPSFPTGTRGPSSGIGLDGDVAITHQGGLMTSSNSDIHSMNTGAGSLGAQGVDSSNSYNGTTDNGSQISSSNRFNTSSPTASFSVLGQNNGVQGGIDHSDLLSELNLLTMTADSLTATHTQTITNSIQVDRLDNFQNNIPELIVFDIQTNGTDLRLDTANWTVQGDADDFVIYRVEPGAILDSQNGNFLLGGDIGMRNVLFYVDAGQGEGSFSFDNTEFFGYSFWDAKGSDDNEAAFNNVRGCGQLITDKVNFNNVSMTHCGFDVGVIPEPSSAMLLGLAGFLLAKRRRTQA